MFIINSAGHVSRTRVERMRFLVRNGGRARRRALAYSQARETVRVAGREQSRVPSDHSRGA
eukprot:5228185-Pyramimonas_sp.AAC.1